MAVLLFIVVVQLAWTFGQAQHLRGGGAYSYTDSTGKRYSGTYGLKDGQVVHTSGDRVAFSDAVQPGYGYGFGYGYQGDDFYPTFFSNFEDILQEAFRSNIENQRLAYDAARKAFDLTSNQAGYFPNFAARLPQPPSFQDFGGYRGGYGGFPNIPNFEMPNFPNAAFASSAIGPGYRHQVAAINPPNPNSRNVNINRISHYSDTPANQNGYVSVSSRSFAASSNINGQELNRRGAETIINDNGKVTKYKVEN